MGVEQDTKVSGSKIDLLPDTDLPDLRLPRAFRVWTDFQIKHTHKAQEIISMLQLVA